MIRNWIGALGCFVLAGISFLMGYWRGEEVSRNDKTTAVVKVTSAFQAHPISPVPSANIPADATPEMREFLQNRVTLANNMAQLHNQNLKAGNNGALGSSEMAHFQQQNADLLKRQSELAQIIAQQQAQKPLTEPPPLKIPPNATPQLQAFLTTRDKLMRGQITMMNQNRTADPKTRQEAMQQWQKDNAGLIEQMKQEAQALANSNKT